MTERRRYFFSGIGGSGMLPLATLVHRQGHIVEGSDRAFDQGRTVEKSDFLRRLGVQLFPQDGSGVCRYDQVLVTSAAVEDTVPDVMAAKALGAGRLRRADLLAELFNAAPHSVGIAGTSGKSTTTAMIGLIMHRCGLEPIIVNGAFMKDFTDVADPFGSVVIDGKEHFVSEIDESDGSIAAYTASIAVLTNVARDHKPLEELRELFGGYLARAEARVVNLDDPESRALAADLPKASLRSFGIEAEMADLVARDIKHDAEGLTCLLWQAGDDRPVPLSLAVPGTHNLSNALAALATAAFCGIPLSAGAQALAAFSGLRRRLDIVGKARGVLVIDDFAHNPHKIQASLACLHQRPGRLLLLFQPHGFGPLHHLMDDFIDVFIEHLAPADFLIVTEPIYFGGTVNRDLSISQLVDPLVNLGRDAMVVGHRDAAMEPLLARARAGDRVVIMGARDDELADYASRLVGMLEKGSVIFGQ
ncbi:Mur ligase family protein [Roseovarius aestuarii]|uniref:UDP-N-acetylmuramate--L-alanine ligase n=1 Tax=Roseovarius aestuarii TaxID=475083 RepID=A0A1X7BWX2_9RHOB|nr:Mur ligase family protein [Roseovarius aestuarii]SMC14000.1 UDP-N-acetylmuramate--L-alanine ligase [Roseovarius aestuarii]